MQPFFTWIIGLFTSLYLSIFVAYQLALLNPGAERNTLTLIQALELGIYLPLPLLCALVLLSRRRIFLVLLIIPTIGFFYHYGQLFLPQTPVNGPTLRVMSWNILFTNTNMHGMIHAIQHEQADIIAVQELSTAQSYVLAQTLKPEYPYQLLKPDQGTRGLGIFSRFPISSEFPEKASGIHCQCQHAIIALKNQSIEIINIHPHIPHIYTRTIRGIKLPIGLNSSTQQDTFEALSMRIEQRSMPMLVLGDLNMTDHQPFYAHLQSSLGDAFREAGWGLGLTYPQNFRLRQLPLPIPALMRLDYILYSQEWQAQAAWINTEPDTDKALGSGSDHAYVVADLVLP